MVNCSTKIKYVINGVKLAKPLAWSFNLCMLVYGFIVILMLGCCYSLCMDGSSYSLLDDVSLPCPPSGDSSH